MPTNRDFGTTVGGSRRDGPLLRNGPTLMRRLATYLQAIDLDPLDYLCNLALMGIGFFAFGFYCWLVCGGRP